MKTYKLGKLVRGGIIASHENHGGVVKWRTLTGAQRATYAAAKVREETDELLDSDLSEVSEYGDAIEAIYHLAKTHGISRNDIQKTMRDKVQRIGDFSKHIYIETATVPDGSWHATYYDKNPERFPEITKEFDE